MASAAVGRVCVRGHDRVTLGEGHDLDPGALEQRRQQAGWGALRTKDDRGLGERRTMALNIKNAKVEQLATEVARRLGVSKSEAVRRALEALGLRCKCSSSASERVGP